MRSLKGLIAHQFLNWTEAHFYEMDATLKLIEKSMADLQADTKKQAEETLGQIGTRRKAFEEAIRGQQPESDAAWAKAKTTLEADWASFEAAVEDYVKNSALPSQEGVKLFRARAEAQGKAWEETINALKKRQRRPQPKGSRPSMPR